MMNPFVATEENKRMVEDNITHLLGNFLKNPNFDFVIFSWIIHKEFIYKILLDKLKSFNFELIKITLMCSEFELLKKLKENKRSDEEIKKSLEYLNYYSELDSIKIDTSDISVPEIVEKIIEVLQLHHLD